VPDDQCNETIAMARLIASLLVALALLVAPLATASGGAAMAQMAACPAAETDTGCPDRDDSQMPCTHGICVSVCAPACLLPAASSRPFYVPAAKASSGPLQRLVGITPEAEIRPPRPLSEM
jgi:hypothetical protein